MKVIVFPHDDPEDFAVSYDAYFSKEVFRGKGRRSKKCDSEYMECLQENINELAGNVSAKVFWDKPL